MTATIKREALEAELDRGAAITLVEALPQQYFDEGHLPGAINIPHDQIRARAPSLLPDKDARIVVYCASATCRNSQLATDTLHRMGYTNAVDYVEGKQGWIEAGLALETAPAQKAS
jgi:rhodanese-related sulfurtransferase